MEIVIRKPSIIEKEQMKMWPIWEKEPSEFQYSYSSRETCLILEGRATVTEKNGKCYDFGKGDIVIFPKGMECTWKIYEKIKKHYNFD